MNQRSLVIYYCWIITLAYLILSNYTCANIFAAAALVLIGGEPKEY